MAKKRTDEDRMSGPVVRPAARPGAPLTAGPPLEPMPNVDEQRQAIRIQIAELEDALRFMGAAHSRRQESEQRLSQLRQILAQLEGSGSV
jgi:hypothetical protein